MTPVEFRGDHLQPKSGLSGLSCCTVTVFLHLAIIVKHQLVTKRQQTDRQTDRQTQGHSIYHASIASRRKNHLVTFSRECHVIVRDASPTWRSETRSDDVKLYYVLMKCTILTTRFFPVYPTAWCTRRTIIQLGSTTVGGMNTSAKTSLRRCRCVACSTVTTWLRMNDPARWTVVGVGRWCRTDVTGNWVTQHSM